MANTPGGSFIPKRSTGKVAPVRSGRRVYIFSYIAYVFFFGTLLSVVGIFFLHQQAKAQLDEYIVRVDEARQAFDRTKIDQIRLLDTRLNTGMQILNQHSAPSKIFTELEEVIVRNVQLTSFGYTKDSDGIATITFGGTTETFDVLLFQREVLASDSFLASADIVNVSYGIPQSELSVEQRDAGAVTASGAFSTVTFAFEDASSMDSIAYTVNDDTADRVEDVTEVLSLPGEDDAFDIDEVLAPPPVADVEVINETE